MKNHTDFINRYIRDDFFKMLHFLIDSSLIGWYFGRQSTLIMGSKTYLATLLFDLVWTHKNTLTRKCNSRWTLSNRKRKSRFAKSLCSADMAMISYHSKNPNFTQCSHLIYRGEFRNRKILQFEILLHISILTNIDHFKLESLTNVMIQTFKFQLFNSHRELTFCRIVWRLHILYARACWHYTDLLNSGVFLTHTIFDIL